MRRGAPTRRVLSGPKARISVSDSQRTMERNPGRRCAPHPACRMGCGVRQRCGQTLQTHALIGGPSLRETRFAFDGMLVGPDRFRPADLCL